MKLIPLAAVALALSLSLAEGVMVCYYGSWAVYRQGEGKFDVEQIDPYLCTHIIFGFAGLGSNNEIRVLDPWNELCDNYGKCAFDRFTALKKKNPSLLTLLAVGGWNEGSAKYSQMAADASKRKTFIYSSIAMLKEHNFDGLDMDWEYPTQRGGAPEDKDNFIILMRELKEALHAEGMLLSAAVSAGIATIEPSYDIPALAEQLDLINLMAYDLHGAWDDYTHHQSGLYAYSEDTGDNVYLNQDYAVNHWINGGMPPNKIALGVPLYARCWSLATEDDTSYYATAYGAGQAGPFTNSPGFLGYNEICDMIQTNGWSVNIAPGAKEPYAYYMPKGKIWCSYDDDVSCAIKAAYAKEKGLAGMMVWSLETDDFHANCHNRKFHLIKTLIEVFSGGDYTTPEPPPTTTPDPGVTTTTPRTTPNTPPPDGVCQKPGINPDPDNCHHYWLCSQNMNGGYDATEEPCAPNTLFNPLAFVCDWDYVVCALDGICVNDCP